MGGKSSRVKEKENAVGRTPQKTIVGGEGQQRGLKRKRSEENFENESLLLTDDEDEAMEVDNKKEEEEFLKIFNEEIMNVAPPPPLSPSVYYSPERDFDESYSSGQSVVSIPPSIVYSDSPLIEIEDDKYEWSHSATFNSSSDRNLSDWDLEADGHADNNEVEDKIDEDTKNKVAEVNCGDDGSITEEEVFEDCVDDSLLESDYCINNTMNCITQAPPPSNESLNACGNIASQVNEHENEESETTGDERQGELYPEVYNSKLMSLLDSGYPLNLVDFQGNMMVKTEMEEVEKRSEEGNIDNNNTNIEGDGLTPRIVDGKLLLPIFKFHGGAFLYHVEECDQQTTIKDSGVISQTSCDSVQGV